MAQVYQSAVVNLTQIHVGRGEFSRAGLLLEQNAQFRICSVFRFRNTEVCENDGQDTCSAVEEARFRTPIPVARIEHVWSDDVAHS